MTINGRCQRQPVKLLAARTTKTHSNHNGNQDTIKLQARKAHLEDSSIFQRLGRTWKLLNHWAGLTLLHQISSISQAPRASLYLL